MVANEAACSADAVHETENLLEYAMVARTEHRLDGAQKHKMEILLGYALASRNPIYFGAPFGWEVVVIPNTFKEAMETPQAAEWKEAADKEMASQEKHERGVRLRVFGLGFLGGEGHRD